MNHAFVFGPFRLYPQSRLLKKSTDEISLGGRAFDVLAAMVERAGEVLSNRELMTVAWPDLVVEESNVRVQIAMLRRKLGCGRDGLRYIVSVAGRGYCFVAPIERVASDESIAPATASSILRIPSAQSAEKPLMPIGQARLPAPLEHATGRQENVVELSQIVTTHRMVTIVGAGGVGKTTLAVLVAHALGNYAGTTRFVDLSGIERDVRIVDAVASAIDVRSVGQDSLQSLLNVFDDRKTLIILDNCEHRIDSIATFVETLLRETQHVHILATSQEALRVRGESIYLLRPLGCPPNTGRLTAKQALAWPAVRLLMERAAEGGHQDVLTDEQAPAVAAICRRLDGNPLSIELIASRISTYGIHGAASLLGNRLALGWRGRRDAAPRHQTVEALLDWSHELLPEVDRKVLHRLSAFVGAFTIEAASFVATDDGVCAADVFNAIGNLTDKSIISASVSDGKTQLRLLDMTRTYASIKLGTSHDARTVARRHALLFANALRTYAHQHEAPGTGHVRTDAPDIRNVRAALEWSFSEDGDIELALELCALAIPLFFDLSLLAECVSWCRRALSGLDSSTHDPERELVFQRPLAIALHFVGESAEEYKNLVEHCIESERRIGDTRHEFQSLAGLHLATIKYGDFGAALNVAKQYEQAAELDGGPREHAMAQWMLGVSMHFIGNQSAALQHFTRGSSLSAEHTLRPTGYLELSYRLFANIGRARVACMRGFPNRALKLVNETIGEARRYPMSLCVCLILGIPVYLMSGLIDQAEVLIHELNELTMRYGLVAYRQASVALFGQLLLKRGALGNALDHLRRHANETTPMTCHIVKIDALRALASCLSASGEHHEAAATIDDAIRLADRTGCKFSFPDLLNTKAEILCALPAQSAGNVDALLLQAIHYARKQGALIWELRAALTYTRVHRASERALDMLAGIYGQFTEGFDIPDLISAAHTLRLRADVIPTH